MMTDVRHCSRRRNEMIGAIRACASQGRETETPFRVLFLVASFCVASWSLASASFAQSVGWPAPRLLTTTPMGGKAGSQVEVTISGENIDDADELAFSDPRITSKRKLNAAGQPEPDKYVVTIAADCPAGVHEARVMTRLGISSSRVFSVGSLPEVIRTKSNTSLASAMELKMNSLCNAATTLRAVDHYFFEGRKGQRVIVDCAARGIDSKLNAVLIIADAAGRDLQVERGSGALDFTVPEDGRYVIKVHELTFQGGPAYFYRLALRELPADAPVARLPSTRTVSSFSWPPESLREQAEVSEIEPNGNRSRAQKISLPCDIAGNFFPAADVDLFEFEAKQGDVWWVEVASARLGLPTDPAILIQHVAGSGNGEKLTDVAEFSDIPSPVKVSSNGYAYDGPPYDAGSPDILAKLLIQKDGVHRLQLSDLFGGTRNDPRNVYRLIIHKAAPDFSLVAWALHMELRNGDRNALSKPIALRGGSTTALEVVVVRRDGFDGEIELVMDGLPKGVTARGLTIPSGKSRGVMLVTANQDAPRSLSSARFSGRAKIGGTTVIRPCRLASMAWPVTDAWREIPSPRLLADVPVSVSGYELAPITIAPNGSDVWEVAAGGRLTIPLIQTRRSEFSGATLKLKALGNGFENLPSFEVLLTADNSQAVLDLAKLKTPPGDYLISFYGSAVAKYPFGPPAVVASKAPRPTARQELTALAVGARNLTNEAKSTPATSTERLKQSTKAETPRDIVDIVVSEPMVIRVKPAETK